MQAGWSVEDLEGGRCRQGALWDGAVVVSVHLLLLLLLHIPLDTGGCILL
jgi:hypothetical protein